MEEGSEGKRGNTKETGVVVYSNLTRNGRAQRGVRARVLTSGSSVGPLLCSGPKRSAARVMHAPLYAVPLCDRLQALSITPLYTFVSTDEHPFI